MKKKKITLIISLLLIGILIIGGVGKEKPDNVILDEVKLISNDNLINRKSFAILVEGDNGNYTDYDGETWPDYSQYRFNDQLSKCTDSEGNDDPDASLSYDKETQSVTVSSNKTVFCKIYFRKKDMTVPQITTFYVGTKTGTEYTTTEKVKYHIEWNDNDVTEYCITEGADSSSCSWTLVDTQNHTIEKEITLSNGEKEYTFRAYVRDLDKNESPSATDTITLDKTAPTVKTVTINNGNDYTKTTSVSVKAEWDDTDVTHYCLKESNSNPSAGDGCWELASNKSATKNVTLTDTEGTRTVYAWIKDGAGHISNSKNDTIYYDKNDPTLSVTQDTPLQETTASITVTANDTGSGIAKYCYKFKASDNFTCKNVTESNANKYTFNSGLSAGQKYNVYVYVEDKAGRTSSQTATYQVQTKVHEPTVSELIKKIYKSDTATVGDGKLIYHDGTGTYTNYQYEAGDKSYRFSGNNPDNWICMYGTNNTGACDKSKMYRVIGWFPKEGNSSQYQMKIIKSEYITSTELGMESSNKISKTSETDFNPRVNITTNIDAFYWSGSSDINWNSWKDSKLNEALNNENGTYLKSLSKYTNLNLIETTKWYIGGNDFNYISRNNYSSMKSAYEYELGNNKLTIDATTCVSGSSKLVQCTEALLYQESKIGLMYATEYGYAASSDNWNSQLYDYDNTQNRSQNWLYNGIQEWTLSRYNSPYYSSYSLDVDYTGWVDNNLSNNSNGVRPVLVISSNSTLSGEGSKEKPWRLSLN